MDSSNNLKLRGVILDMPCFNYNLTNRESKKFDEMLMQVLSHIQDDTYDYAYDQKKKAKVLTFFMLTLLMNDNQWNI